MACQQSRLLGVLLDAPATCPNRTRLRMTMYAINVIAGSSAAHVANLHAIAAMRAAGNARIVLSDQPVGLENQDPIGGMTVGPSPCQSRETPMDIQPLTMVRRQLQLRGVRDFPTTQHCNRN